MKKMTKINFSIFSLGLTNLDLEFRVKGWSSEDRVSNIFFIGFQKFQNKKMLFSSFSSIKTLKKLFEKIALK